MQKKNIIITVSVILVLFLLSLVAYYFLSMNNSGTTRGAGSGFKSFFPFGGNNTEPQVSSSTPITETPSTKQPVQNFNIKLRQISSRPVAGAGTLDVKAGTIVRYIEKATGHIYEVELFSPRSDRISNTTIPLVYTALWGNKNNSLLAQYLEDDNQTVDTYSLTIKETSTSTENVIAGTLLPSNTKEVSVFGNSIFYTISSSGSSEGYIANFNDSKLKKVWNSNLTEISPQFVNEKTVAITTKPASNIPGFMYFVDTTTGAVKKILDSVNGLSTLTNPTNTQVAYISQTDTLKMYLFDTKTNTATRITPETFPEKCVWSKKNKAVMYCAVPTQKLNGNSLTSWYLGLTSYTDYIWKYDTSDNASNIISDLTSDSGISIDAENLSLSENEQYLVFMNKRDNSLWSLDLLQ